MAAKARCFLILALLGVFISSCSSYMTDQGGFFSKFQKGQFKEAADLIKDKSEKSGKDQILFLLDRGTALFEAKDYKGAIEVFTKAEELTRIKDYTSINEEVVSVVTTDTYKKFYPLDYELIMINFYLALSYYMEEKYDDAVVECRRINNIINKLRDKGMNSFEESPIAWYLSASIYDIQKKYSDARIDYEHTMALAPYFKQAVYDAYRTSRLSNNLNRAMELEKEYPDLELRDYYKNICKKCGDVIVLFSAGEIPIKRQSSRNDMLPEFYTRSYNVGNLLAFNSEGKELGITGEVTDLEIIARKNLDERVGKIVAKRLLGIGTQVGIGYGVAKATKSEAAGIITGLLLHAASTQADTRSWSTLPKSFQIARISLPEGDNELVFKPTKASGQIGQEIIKNITLSRGDVKLVLIRVF
ncbi:MAG: hypothetical protein NTY22_03275 [Proteobacteria bacterium]|nr:hypothetical protein [Pseudomonadota bacterium]